MDPNTNQINLRDIVWVGGIPTAPSLPTGATITVLVSEAGADGTLKTAKFINGKNVPIEEHEDCSRVAEGTSGLMMRIGIYRDRVSYLTAGTPSYYQERDTGDTRGFLGTGMIDRGRILDIPGWQEWKTPYWDYGTGFFVASEELHDM